jgi:hypothetical protein
MEEAMKLSSFILGSIFAVAVIAVVLLVFGVVSFQQPLSTQGAALYNPANEIVVKGTVSGAEDFTCPIAEHEVGSHLILDTVTGPVVIHLAPARVMRSQQLAFTAGDKLDIVGSKFRFGGRDGIIAKEITRGSETYVLRDPEGKLLLVQQ